MKLDILEADDQAGEKDTFDKIQEHWLSGGKVELSEKQLEINRRWKTAFSLLENEGYSDSEVVKSLTLYFDISKMQAYRDIKAAKMLFSDIVEVNAKIERYFVLQEAKLLLRTAKAKQDLKAQASAIKLITEIAGISSNNMDAEMYKKLEQHNVFINISDKQQKMLEMMTKSGTYDFSQLMSNAEAITWEDVENAE